MSDTIEGASHPYRCRVIVRPGEEGDTPRLVQLGRHFYEQTAYQRVPYSESGAAGWFKMMRDHGLLFVAQAGSDVIGVIGGISSPFIVNPAHGVGMEMLMWVEPEHRSSGVAMQMMDAVEDAARDLGLTYWSMMSLEAVQPEAAAALYNKRGYKLAEHTFVKEL